MTSKGHDPNHKRKRRGWDRWGATPDLVTESALTKAMVKVAKRRPYAQGVAIRGEYRTELRPDGVRVQGYQYGDVFVPFWSGAWPAKAARRARKKLAQPYRNKHNRGRMRARAAGKNNTRPSRGAR